MTRNQHFNVKPAKELAGARELSVHKLTTLHENGLNQS